MRTLRRAGAPAAAGLLAVLITGPAAAVAPPSAGAVTVRQSILTELSPTGEAGISRVFTQVAADGAATVTLPGQSTTALRGLSGFARPAVDDGAVTWAFDEAGLRRSVASNDAGVPVEFAIAYTLDGEVVDPDDLAGRSGELTVTYRVRNTTGVPTEVSYVDGRGHPRTRTVDVPVPLVGSMSTVLDERFGDVEAPGAAVVGDGRGNTVVNWSLLLFAPLGADEAEVSYTAQVRDAIVPPTSAQIIPVSSASFNSMASATETYGDAAASTTALTEGAAEIHSNLRTLANGAGQLLNGLNALSAGARKLSNGLGDAASGSGELAAGMSKAADGGGELASGLGELEDGAGKLADGLDKASAGTTELGAGLGQLAAGAGELSAGLGQARGGSSELALGLAALDAGAAKLGAGAGALAAGAKELDAKTGELVDGTVKLSAGAGKLVGGLDTLKKSINASDGLPAALGGVSQLSAGVGKVITGIGTPDPTTQTLLGGLAAMGLGLSNPACDMANPTAAENPCGIKEILTIMEMRSGLADAGLGEMESGLADGLLAAGTIDTLAGSLASTVAPGATVLELTCDEVMLAYGTGGNGHDPVALGLRVIECLAEGLVDGIGSAAEPDSLLWGAKQLRDGVAESIGALQLLQGGITTKLSPGVTRLMRGLDNPDALALNPTCAATTDPAKACGAKQGLQLVQGGLGQLSGGLSGALAKINAGLGSVTVPGETLLYGAGSLAAGAGQLSTGAARLRSEGTTPLAAGAGQLADGAGQLADGAAAAAAGGQKLAGGLVQLDDGGKALAAGATKAADGTSALVNGLGQLADGGRQLAAGAGKAATGAGDLAEGLDKLDAGAGKLAAGLGTAAEGSGFLADGLEKAAAGADKVADGSQRLLYEGTGVLTDAVNDAAAETGLTVAHLAAVDARGLAEATPYAVPEGAVASAVYSFEIAGVEGSKGLSEPGRAATAAGIFGATAGLGLVSRRRFGIL